MQSRYYKIPLNFEDLIDPEVDHDHSSKALTLQIKKTADLKRSINEHIELILTTHYGEYKYDRNYGFIIWDKEFENMEIDKFNTHDQPRRSFEESMKKTLILFEPRLENIRVEIFFRYKRVFKGRSIKYFVDIDVHGILPTSRGEEYHNKFQFAVGPLFK